METILGFVAGYLAGAQDGPDGLKRLKESVRSILNSAEVRRLALEALTLGEAVARGAASRGLTSIGGSVGDVTDALVHRAAAAVTGRDSSRAA